MASNQSSLKATALCMPACLQGLSGDAYTAKKQETADELCRRLEALLPGLPGAIDMQEVGGWLARKERCTAVHGRHASNVCVAGWPRQRGAQPFGRSIKAFRQIWKPSEGCAALEAWSESRKSSKWGPPCNQVGMLFAQEEPALGFLCPAAAAPKSARPRRAASHLRQPALESLCLPAAARRSALPRRTGDSSAATVALTAPSPHASPWVLWACPSTGRPSRWAHTQGRCAAAPEASAARMHALLLTSIVFVRQVRNTTHAAHATRARNVDMHG